MNGFNEHFGSGQGYGTISSHGFGNQQSQGTLSIEQYAYSSDLGLNADQSSTLNQLINQEQKNPSSDQDNDVDLIIENVAQSALHKEKDEHLQAQLHISKENHSKTSEKLDITKEQAKFTQDKVKQEVVSSVDKSNKSAPIAPIAPMQENKDQSFVHMKSKKKNKAKNKGANHNKEQLANEPHNKPIKEKAPLVHVDEPPVRTKKTEISPYYELSVPFGRRTRLKVMNEPNIVKSNLGLTQTSFERFENAPVMQVAAYGFSGVAYTQIARDLYTKEYLLDEIRANSALHGNEIPFSHANESKSQNFYSRERSYGYPVSSSRKLFSSTNSSAYNRNNQVPLPDGLEPFYSAQKTVNGTRLSIKAYNTKSKLGLTFGKDLVRSIVEQQNNQLFYGAAANPHVTMHSSKSTNITYALPPVQMTKQIIKDHMLLEQAKQATKEAQKQVIALDQAQKYEQQQKAQEIQSDIMEQGHTILSGNVSYTQPEQEAQKSIVIVRSKPSAFETSGEVKTIIRNNNALALHGMNAPILAHKEYLRLSQQVTLPDDYLLELEQKKQEPSVFELRPKTLLGSESTRIVSTSNELTRALTEVFATLPMVSDDNNEDNDKHQALALKQDDDMTDLAQDLAQINQNEALELNSSDSKIKAQDENTVSKSNENTKKSAKGRNRRKR